MEYIEFRIYLKPGAEIREVLRAADVLQNSIASFVAQPEAPKIFTQDVSYEISTTLVVTATSEKVN